MKKAALSDSIRLLRERRGARRKFAAGMRGNVALAQRIAQRVTQEQHIRETLARQFRSSYFVVTHLDLDRRMLLGLN